MEKKRFEPYHFREKLVPDLFEKMATDRGLWVCGIDESGRGPSAGPVVAAAAIVRLQRGKRKLLQDSKLLTKGQRIEAYNWIICNSWHGIGVVSHRLIDEIGIYQANIMAMNRAFAQLQASCSVSPSIVLVDAVRLDLPPLAVSTVCPDIEGPYDLLSNLWHKIIYFPHSEQYSYSIAAASIIAKVTRDAIMDNMGQSFPSYKLEVHKGYHTVRHRELLHEHGPTIIHRASFLRKKDEEVKDGKTMPLFMQQEL